jgi:hypothetical protein
MERLLFGLRILDSFLGRNFEAGPNFVQIKRAQSVVWLLEVAEEELERAHSWRELV